MNTLNSIFKLVITGLPNAEISKFEFPFEQVEGDSSDVFLPGNSISQKPEAKSDLNEHTVVKIEDEEQPPISQIKEASKILEDSSTKPTKPSESGLLGKAWNGLTTGVIYTGLGVFNMFSERNTARRVIENSQKELENLHQSNEIAALIHNLASTLVSSGISSVIPEFIPKSLSISESNLIEIAESNLLRMFLQLLSEAKKTFPNKSIHSQSDILQLVIEFLVNKVRHNAQGVNFAMIRVELFNLKPEEKKLLFTEMAAELVKIVCPNGADDLLLPYGFQWLGKHYFKKYEKKLPEILEEWTEKLIQAREKHEANVARLQKLPHGKELLDLIRVAKGQLRGMISQALWQKGNIIKKTAEDQANAVLGQVMEKLGSEQNAGFHELLLKLGEYAAPIFTLIVSNWIPEEAEESGKHPLTLIISNLLTSVVNFSEAQDSHQLKTLYDEYDKARNKALDEEDIRRKKEKLVKFFEPLASELAAKALQGLDDILPFGHSVIESLVKEKISDFCIDVYGNVFAPQQEISQIAEKVEGYEEAAKFIGCIFEEQWPVIKGALAESGLDIAENLIETINEKLFQGRLNISQEFFAKPIAELMKEPILDRVSGSIVNYSKAVLPALLANLAATYPGKEGKKNNVISGAILHILHIIQTEVKDSEMKIKLKKWKERPETTPAEKKLKHLHKMELRKIFQPCSKKMMEQGGWDWMQNILAPSFLKETFKDSLVSTVLPELMFRISCDMLLFDTPSVNDNIQEVVESVSALGISGMRSSLPEYSALMAFKANQKAAGLKLSALDEALLGKQIQELLQDRSETTNQVWSFIQSHLDNLLRRILPNSMQLRQLLLGANLPTDMVQSIQKYDKRVRKLKEYETRLTALRNEAIGLAPNAVPDTLVKNIEQLQARCFALEEELDKKNKIKQQYLDLLKKFEPLAIKALRVLGNYTKAEDLPVPFFAQKILWENLTTAILPEQLLEIYRTTWVPKDNKIAPSDAAAAYMVDQGLKMIQNNVKDDEWIQYYAEMITLNLEKIGVKGVDKEFLATLLTHLGKEDTEHNRITWTLLKEFLTPHAAAIFRNMLSGSFNEVFNLIRELDPLPARSPKNERKFRQEIIQKPFGKALLEFHDKVGLKKVMEALDAYNQLPEESKEQARVEKSQELFGNLIQNIFADFGIDSSQGLGIHYADNAIRTALKEMAAGVLFDLMQEYYEGADHKANLDDRFASSEEKHSEFVEARKNYAEFGTKMMESQLNLFWNSLIDSVINRFPSKPDDAIRTYLNKDFKSKILESILPVWGGVNKGLRTLIIEVMDNFTNRIQTLEKQSPERIFTFEVQALRLVTEHLATINEITDELGYKHMHEVPPLEMLKEFEERDALHSSMLPSEFIEKINAAKMGVKKAKKAFRIKKSKEAEDDLKKAEAALAAIHAEEKSILIGTDKFPGFYYRLHDWIMNQGAIKFGPKLFQEFISNKLKENGPETLKTLAQKALEPQLLHKYILTLLSKVNENLKKPIQKSVPDTEVEISNDYEGKEEVQAIAASLVEQLGKALPGTILSSLTEIARIREFSGSQIEAALRDALKENSLLEMIKNGFVAGADGLLDESIPRTPEEVKAQAKKIKANNIKIQEEIRKQEDSLLNYAKETPARKIKEAWDHFQASLDQMISDYGKAPGREVKSFLDKIFHLIFFDIIGTPLVWLVSLPYDFIWFLWKLHVMKHAKQVQLDIVKPEIHANLLMNLADEFMKAFPQENMAASNTE